MFDQYMRYLCSPTGKVKESDESDSEKEEKSKKKKGKGKKKKVAWIPEMFFFFSKTKDDSSYGIHSAKYTTSLSQNQERSPSPEIEFDDLETFVMEPAPQGVTVKCRVTRDQRGVDKSLYPLYYLHLDNEKKVKKHSVTNVGKSQMEDYFIGQNVIISLWIKN